MPTIKLSLAQSSAFECRDWSEEPFVTAAWDGDGILAFEREDAESIYREINDASNAEDAFAEDRGNDKGCRACARRSASSLACVAGKVLRYEIMSLNESLRDARSTIRRHGEALTKEAEDISDTDCGQRFTR